MRLVEGVVREGLEHLPQRVLRRRTVAVHRHAAEEVLLLLVELGLLLLAHRAAEDVGLAEAEAGELLRRGHHLLLVDDETVGGAENVGQRRLELGMDRLDLLQPVLAQRVVGVRVHAHRSRPVQRQDGRDVFEVVGLHEPQQAPHRTAVELEDTEGVSAGEQLVRGRVVECEVFEHELLAAVRGDVIECVIDDREVAQPQEVHLDQAERLAGRVVELRDDLAVLLALHDRDDVDQRLARHDHAGGVHAPLALEVLQAHGGVEDRLGLGIRLDQRAEFGGFLEPRVILVEHALQGHVLAHHGRRHRLGELLAHAEREAEHAARVLQRLLGLDRAVGDDLGHALVAVLLGDVLDDLAAAPVVEVDVEVGHRDAVGVEEPLEQQPVLERIEVGDPHRVRGHRPGARAAAGTDPDAVLLGPVDEVRHDEEVAGEAHLHDDAGFEVGPRADLRRDAGRIPRVQAPLDLLDEPALLGLAGRDRVARHVVGARVEVEVGPLGDRERVVARLGVVAEDVPHLRGRLEVELLALELESLGVVESGAGLHAQQRGMALGVVLVRVVQVVRRDQRAGRAPSRGAAGRSSCGARCRCRDP